MDFSRESARLLRPYRRRIYVAGFLCAALVAVSIGLFCQTSQTEVMAAGFVGLIASAIVFIFALGSRELAQRVERHLAEIQAGKVLARWQYTPDEWQRFRAARRWASVLASCLEAAILAVVFAGTVAPLVLFWKPTPASEFRDTTIIAVGALVLGVGLWILGARNWARWMPGPPTDCYIGRDFVLFEGKFSLWGEKAYLGRLEIVPGPPAILEGALFTMGTRAGHWTRFRVLVPAKETSVAQKVVKTLSEKHPKLG